MPGGAVSVAGERLAAPERKLLHRLRAAAVRYTEAGWPILPLSPAGDRLVAGMSPGDPGTARDWWSQQPYGIGCSVGARFDVLEMPTRLGELVLTELPESVHLAAPAVIEVPAQGCWLFLVTPGGRRNPELSHRQVRLRCRQGDWVPLPPTPVVAGEVLWVGKPPVLERLPHSLTVQAATRKVLLRQSGSRLLAGGD